MSRLNAITQFRVVEQTYYRAHAVWWNGRRSIEGAEAAPDVRRHIKCRFFCGSGVALNILGDWLTLLIRAVGPSRIFGRIKVYLCIR